MQDPASAAKPGPAARQVRSERAGGRRAPSRRGCGTGGCCPQGRPMAAMPPAAAHCGCDGASCPRSARFSQHTPSSSSYCACPASRCAHGQSTNTLAVDRSAVMPTSAPSTTCVTRRPLLVLRSRPARQQALAQSRTQKWTSHSHSCSRHMQMYTPIEFPSLIEYPHVITTIR